MTKRGNRKTGSYSEKRLRYYDAVVSMYMAGMSPAEIACVIPVGKSSVLRWVDEYKAGFGDDEILFDVSKSPQMASFVLHRMRQYVARLEKIVESQVAEEACSVDNLTLRLPKAPTLSLRVLKSKPNKDGSYDIKISLSRKTKTVYISTGCCINNLSEWNGAAVINRDDAEYLNRQLRNLLSLYRQYANGLPEEIEAKEAKHMLEDRINKIAKQYIK